MKLSEYLVRNEITQAAFSGVVNVTVGMVNQWISGHRPISPIQCVAIEVATHGEVTRKDLRPNDWQAIWPELIEAA